MSTTDPVAPADSPADPYTATTPESVAGARARNALGTASLIVASVIVLVSLIRSGFTIFIPQLLNDFELSIAALNGGLIMVAIIEGILGLAAVVLGWLALVRPGVPKAAAGAGVAIGAATLLNLVVTFVVSFIANGY